ncbi:MAG: hypothetical protein AAGA69_02035 [Pseudomonadota bacterium]
MTVPVAGTSWREMLLSVWQPTTSCDSLAVFSAVTSSGYFYALVAVIGWLAFRRFEATRLQVFQFDPPIPNRNYTTNFRYLFAGGVYVLLLLGVFLAFVMIISVDDFLRVVVAGLDRIGLDLVPASEGVCLRGLDGETYLLPTEQQYYDVRAVLHDQGPGWAMQEERFATLEDRLFTVLTGAFGFFIVLITLPFITPQDIRLRDWLHRFASVPVKARLVADQIVAGAPMAIDMPGRFARVPQTLIDNKASDIRTYLGLRAIIEEMMEDISVRYPRYKSFFGEMAPNLQRIQERVDLLHDNIEVTESSRRFYNAEMGGIIQQLALLMACSTLKNEADEFRAVQRLKGWGVDCIEAPRFRFSGGLLGVGALVVVIAWFVSSLGTGLAVMADVSGSLPTERILGAAGAILGWGAGQALGLVLSNIFPLVIAAGVGAYLADGVVARRGGRGGTETFSYALFAFLLSWGVVIVLFNIMAPSSSNPCVVEDTPLAVWALWSIPPAMLSALFVILTAGRPTGSATINVLIDFVITASVLGGAYYFLIGTSLEDSVYAESLRCLAQEQFQGTLTMEEQDKLIRYGFPVTGGVIPGALVAVIARLARRTR